MNWSPEMLPDVDDNGNLPPGIHPATLEESVEIPAEL
jgi:hypothetical protein